MEVRSARHNQLILMRQPPCSGLIHRGVIRVSNLDAHQTSFRPLRHRVVIVHLPRMRKHRDAAGGADDADRVERIDVSLLEYCMDQIFCKSRSD